MTCFTRIFRCVGPTGPWMPLPQTEPNGKFESKQGA